MGGNEAPSWGVGPLWGCQETEACLIITLVELEIRRGSQRHETQGFLMSTQRELQQGFCKWCDFWLFVHPESRVGAIFGVSLNIATSPSLPLSLSPSLPLSLSPSLPLSLSPSLPLSLRFDPVLYHRAGS